MKLIKSLFFVFLTSITFNTVCSAITVRELASQFSDETDEKTTAISNTIINNALHDASLHQASNLTAGQELDARRYLQVSQRIIMQSLEEKANRHVAQAPVTAQAPVMAPTTNVTIYNEKQESKPSCCKKLLALTATLGVITTAITLVTDPSQIHSPQGQLLYQYVQKIGISMIAIPGICAIYKFILKHA